MTPYPQPGPPPAPHGPRGGGSYVVLFVLVGVGALVALGIVVSVLAVRVARRARLSGITASATTTAELPAVTRRVPHHPLSMLDGCSDADLHVVADGIDDAISVGAPLYNSGNFAGCYHLYAGTAEDVEHRLPVACAGPSAALEAGRRRAASHTDPSAQAWAMRDAFDGLLEVLERAASSH
jgi:serine protease Do